MPSLPPLSSLPLYAARLVRWSKRPAVVQTLRSTAAATLAYATAVLLTDGRPPLLAPLTALLVVQVTLYATLTSGVRRVNAVVAGVTLAVGFSTLAGLSWWSLGLLILMSLTVGHLVRAHQFVPEVAISAMLVLGVTQATDLAYTRIVETLIGAAVGLLFNVLFVPPVWVQPAEEAVVELSRRMWWLLRHMSEELGVPTPVDRIAAKLHAARGLDNDIAQVDASLVRAEESLRFNPRAREGPMSRIVLRTGLDTLEICTVVMRAVTRTLTDLAKERTEEPLFPEDVAAGLEDLFKQLAEAVHSFAVLVTSPVSSRAEDAEERLQTAMEACRAGREKVAHLLLGRVREHPRQWQLHGALLAEIDRILDELDVEKRSARLAEDLDRHTGRRRERYSWLHTPGRLVRRVRTGSGTGNGSSTGAGSGPGPERNGHG